MSKIKQNLLDRKKEIEKQLEPLYLLKEELEEINKMLTNSERGGWESPGCPNGCRCSKCYRPIAIR